MLERLRVFGSLGDKYVREICHEAADEIESLRQQLAECQAALAVKDSAIESILARFGIMSDGCIKQAREALAIQPGTEALEKLWGEPVGFVASGELEESKRKQQSANLWMKKYKDTDVPLYVKPKGLP